MGFKFLEHTSEAKFVAEGSTLEAAFESVVLAFSDLVSGGQEVGGSIVKSVSVSGKDKKVLLRKFLEELIYLFDAENFLVSSGKFVIKGNSLVADLKGDDSSKYSGLDHVKAVTYAEMKAERSANGWILQAVLDV